MNALSKKLFEPYFLVEIKLNNRIVMAPLTRRRAENDPLAPNDIMAAYYRQRASAGLIVAEASPISPYGYGYTGTPGCYTPAQVEGWKKVITGILLKKLTVITWPIFT